MSTQVRPVRTVLVLVAACALAVAALSPPAQAAPPMTAALSNDAFALGGTAVIRGTVTIPTATPRVVLQRQIAGVWYDRDTAPVDQRLGHFTIRFTPSQAGTYTLRVRSAGGSLLSPVLTLRVSTATTISAQLSTPVADRGQTMEVTGGVTPPRATGRVVLQRLVDGVWSDRNAALVDPATGSYTIAVTPGQVGTYVLRVRSNGGTVVSRTLYLPVSGPT